METTFGSFKNFVAAQDQTELMPVLFVGHGSPMNGIEDNPFSREWASLAVSMPRPVAVLVISAHWYTRGTKICAVDYSMFNTLRPEMPNLHHTPRIWYDPQPSS